MKEEREGEIILQRLSANALSPLLQFVAAVFDHSVAHRSPSFCSPCRRLVNMPAECSKCPTNSCPNIEVTLELLHEKKKSTTWECEFSVGYCDPHRGSTSIRFGLANKEEYASLAMRFVQKLRACNQFMAKILMCNAKKEKESESKRIHVVEEKSEINEEFVQKKSYTDVQKSFLSFLNDIEKRPVFIRIMQRKVQLREVDFALLQWGIDHSIGISIDTRAPFPLDFLCYQIQLKTRMEMGKPHWKLEMCIRPNDSFMGTIEIRFQLPNEGNYFSLATRLVQMLRGAEDPFRMKMKKRTATKRPTTPDEQEDQNLEEAYKIVLNFIAETKLTPEYLHIDKWRKSPTDIDIDLVSMAIENSADVDVETLTAFPLDSLRNIVENYLKGNPLSRGCFEWTADDRNRERIEEFEKIIEGARVLHQTTVGIGFSHAYLERGRDEPAFRIVFGQTGSRGCCGGGTFSYFLKWGPMEPLKARIADSNIANVNRSMERYLSLM